MEHSILRSLRQKMTRYSASRKYCWNEKLEAGKQPVIIQLRMHQNKFKLLGKGNKSLIYLYQEFCVLKMVDVTYAKQLQHLRNQFDQMSSCDHPNILKVLRLQHNIPLNECRRDVLQMEYANQGSLLAYLKKGVLPELKKALAVQLTTALEYLHLEKHMAHRDIKLDNILIRRQGDGTITALISDFGFAIKNPNPILEEYGNPNINPERQGLEAPTQNLQRNGSSNQSQQVQFQPFLTNSYKGTKRGYMAPQILNFRGKMQGYNPFKVDVFSFGVVLFCLFFEMLPFEYACPKDPLFKLIVEMKFHEFWAKHSINELKYSNINLEELKTLLQGMLCHIPENRYSINDVIESDFIQAIIAADPDQEELSSSTELSTPPSNQHQLD